MAQEFWYPTTADITSPPAGWNSGGGTGGNRNGVCIPGGGRTGPATHDDDTSYMYITTNESYAFQALNIDWPGPMAAYPNTVFTAGVRDKMSGVGYITYRYAYIVNAAAVYGAAFAGAADVNTAWTTRAPVSITAAATYRPGGGSWGVADFANSTTMYVGMSKANDPTGFHTGYWTSVWGEIAYAPAGGGFVFMLGLAGLSALPFVGRMTDFTAFRKFLDWREVYHPRHTKWDGPEEVLTAWRDIQAYRWPTYHFQAA